MLKAIDIPNQGHFASFSVMAIIELEYHGGYRYINHSIPNEDIYLLAPFPLLSVIDAMGEVGGTSKHGLCQKVKEEGHQTSFTLPYTQITEQSI